MGASDPRKQIIINGRQITITYDKLDTRLEVSYGGDMVVVEPNYWSYNDKPGYGYAVYHTGLHSIESSPELAIEKACELLISLYDRGGQDLWEHLTDYYTNLPGTETAYAG